MHLLQKMGWRPGEGLGKEKNGSLQPLLLEVKLDKRGLVADEEVIIYFSLLICICILFIRIVYSIIPDATKSASKGSGIQEEGVVNSNGKAKYGKQASSIVAWRIVC